jgi:hypothetical protein
MTTIVISPALGAESSNPETIQLQVLVQEADWLGLYDQVEVWRARDTSGLYEELTAATWLPARLPKDAGDPPDVAVPGPSLVVDGKSLQLKVNEVTDLDVVVSGTDPLTTTQVAVQITAQGGRAVVSYVDALGQLAVETVEPGTGASLRVVGGDVAALTELPIDELVYGRNPRLGLRSGATAYSFFDLWGTSASLYKTRFRNRLTGAVSEFSAPFSAGQALGLSASSVVVGYLNLVDMNGKPLAYRAVVVGNQLQGALIEDKFVAGRGETKLTDVQGHVEFQLVRGQTVTVAISGTDVVREILVPTDVAVSVFNLLSSSVGTGEDMFKVSVPELVYAERRSL